jgi:DNA-binding IclR family transcriptional regulator
MPDQPSGTLLPQLLRLLADGAIHSRAELARRLGIGEALMSAMLDDLQRRGYLAAFDPSCGERCAGCGIRSTCEPDGSSAPAPRLLALTERGARATAGLALRSQRR